MHILQKLRGAFGLGLAWASVWAVVGFAAHPLLRLATNGPPGFYGAVGDALWVGWYGFLAGTAFSAVLAVVGRGRSLHELAPTRMALMGASASVLLTLPPTLYMVLSRPDGFRTSDAAYFGASLALCTACAVGSLLLARRRSPPPHPNPSNEPHPV